MEENATKLNGPFNLRMEVVTSVSTEDVARGTVDMDDILDTKALLKLLQR
jgi:hypothetical protein